MFDRVFRQVVVAGVLSAVGAAAVSAQLVNGRWQPPRQTAGGGTAPTQKQGVQTRRAPAVANQSNTSVVPVRVIPAVVMSDGSIYADFGAGLEVVRRACASNVSSMPLHVVGSTATVTNPNLPAVPGIQPAPGMQPVPAMQPAPGQSRPDNAVSAERVSAAHRAAQSSCHLRDGNGRAFATR